MDQSFNDVNWQGESDAPDILLPGIGMEKDVASGVCEGSGQELTRDEQAL